MNCIDLEEELRRLRSSANPAAASAALSAAFESHLAECVDCREQFEFEQQCASALSAWKSNVAIPAPSAACSLDALTALALAELPSSNREPLPSSRLPSLVETAATRRTASTSQAGRADSDANTKPGVTSVWGGLVAVAAMVLVGCLLIWDQSSDTPQMAGRFLANRAGDRQVATRSSGGATGVNRVPNGVVAEVIQRPTTPVPVTETFSLVWREVRDNSAAAAQSTVASLDQFPQEMLASLALPSWGSPDAEFNATHPMPGEEDNMEPSATWFEWTRPVGDQLGGAVRFLGAVLPSGPMI